MNISTNPCTRCGKERIVARVWQEKIKTFSGFIVETRSDNVCPDKECQKLVEKELKAQWEKREKMRQNKTQQQKQQAKKIKKGKKK